MISLDTHSDIGSDIVVDYQTTHPWLTFTLDLRRIPWDAWLLLGEATSKCAHIAGSALDPPTAEKLMRIYLAKGALATTAIEGNTLTDEEAQQRIAGQLRLPPSKEYLGVEIDDIVDASNWLGERYQRGERLRITPELIADLNGRVLANLPVEEHVRPGDFRTYSVGVADYRAVAPADVRPAIERLCRWLGEPWIPPSVTLQGAERERLEAVLKAILAHVYIAWIHPFGDGNGRTARLLEFALLIDGGVPFPAAHLLSNHYNETRTEYYRQLRQTSKSGGDLAPFISYALRGFVDQLRAQIRAIREYQLDLFWEQHLQKVLGDSETGRRRRYLVLDLGAKGEPVPRSALTEVSVRVMRHYARVSDKTLLRDIEQLESLGLVHRTERGYLANRELVTAFVPPGWAAEQ
jgi:Fic family protein